MDASPPRPPTGRYAPSPTGDLHVGNLRTALLAWLFARSSGGRFLLRFEDLDAVRSRPEFEDGQRRDLAALGLDWDDERRQSEAVDRHLDALADLERAGLTYPCWCTRREIREAVEAPHGDGIPEGAYPGTCRDLGSGERSARERSGRPAAIRFRGDGREITVHDRLRGRYTGLVDDLVLLRNDGVPAYQLVVVVDDAADGVTEVVRADDLLPSTPRQLALHAALGLEPPGYAHVPLVLGPDGERLAKRHGAISRSDLLAVGWSDDRLRSVIAASVDLAGADEAPSAAELLTRFDPDRLPAAPWRFTPDGLGP